MNFNNLLSVLNSFLIIIKLKFNLIQIVTIVLINTIVTIFDVFTLLGLPLVISIFLSPGKKYLGYSFNEMHYPYLILLLAFLFLLRFIFLILISKKNSIFIWSITERLNQHVYSLYINLPYIDFYNKKISRMVRDVTGEVTSISQVSYSVITAISEILIILVTFILFLLYDFKLAIISLCSFSLIFFFIHTIISKKIHSAGTKRVHEERKMYDLATNSFIGVKEIISNELYDYYARTYEGLINERSKACSNQMHLSFIPRIIFEFLIVLCILSMLFYYIVFVGENLSQIITFIAGLTAVSFRVLPGVSRLINSLQTINFNSLTISHYSNLVSQNSKNNFKPIFNSISNDYIISAENIAFSYPKTETIYKIPELIIKPGEIIGIRGESGSGKSTLISIILGLYGTNEGTLSYNKNIKTISDIGYVDQKVQILEDTIFYNVTFSNSYDEESVENFTKVLKMVGLFDFYQKTCLSDPKFQLKMLGENISGGQAQRIGIARALYKKSIFLILDEFTSALDEDNENRLLSLLNEFRNERAILIVSHSNNVLKSCDKTYILKNQILCLQ